MVVSLLVMQVVHPAFIPTLPKLTRIHWLIGLSLIEAKTFLKVPVSIKVVASGPLKMQIHFVRYTTNVRFGKNPQIFTLYQVNHNARNKVWIFKEVTS